MDLTGTAREWNIDRIDRQKDAQTESWDWCSGLLVEKLWPSRSPMCSLQSWAERQVTTYRGLLQINKETRRNSLCRRAAKSCSGSPREDFAILSAWGYGVFGVATFINNTSTQDFPHSSLPQLPTLGLYCGAKSGERSSQVWEQTSFSILLFKKSSWEVLRNSQRQTRR